MGVLGIGSDLGFSIEAKNLTDSIDNVRAIFLITSV